MGYQPHFTDTCLIRMKQHDLKEWEVLRAFESSDKKYQGDKIVGKADLGDKLISAMYVRLNNGDDLIISCWSKPKKKETYYGKSVYKTSR